MRYITARTLAEFGLLQTVSLPLGMVPSLTLGRVAPGCDIPGFQPVIPVSAIIDP